MKINVNGQGGLDYNMIVLMVEREAAALKLGFSGEEHHDLFKTREFFSYTKPAPAYVFDNVL